MRQLWWIVVGTAFTWGCDMYRANYPGMIGKGSADLRDLP